MFGKPNKPNFANSRALRLWNPRHEKPYLLQNNSKPFSQKTQTIKPLTKITRQTVSTNEILTTNTYKSKANTPSRHSHVQKTGKSNLSRIKNCYTKKKTKDTRFSEKIFFFCCWLQSEVLLPSETSSSKALATSSRAVAAARRTRVVLPHILHLIR
jgi:hypothetical protein